MICVLILSYTYYRSPSQWWLATSQWYSEATQELERYECTVQSFLTMCCGQEAMENATTSWKKDKRYSNSFGWSFCSVDSTKYMGWYDASGYQQILLTKEKEKTMKQMATMKIKKILMRSMLWKKWIMEKWLLDDGQMHGMGHKDIEDGVWKG